MTAALAISILALLVSAVSLCWNVYRDVILKPRVKVAFQVVTFFRPAENDRPFFQSPPFLELKVTNHGPGEVVINGAVARLVPLVRLLFAKFRYQFLIPDSNHPYCFKLPHRLAVGGQATVMFPFDKGCFLAEKPKRIGVVDSFGRTHWTSRRELKNALREYRKSFPAEKR